MTDALPNLPREIFTQNSELRPLGIYNWTIPAFVVQLTSGKHMNVCPNAGVCASVCYARNGTYNFPTVKQAHVSKLEFYLNDPELFYTTLNAELKRARYKGKWIRIHDSGDYFDESYLRTWLRLARANPQVMFYSYTKEVAMFRRVIERGVIVTKRGEGFYEANSEDGVLSYTDDHPEKARRHVIEWIDQREAVEPDCEIMASWPTNFLYCYSMGGKQDDMLDKDVDRHAEVFATFKGLWDAGYDDQEDDDRGCVTNENTRVGIIQNNIPSFKKKMAGRSFGDMQDERDSVRNDRKERLRLEALASNPETGAPLSV